MLAAELLLLQLPAASALGVPLPPAGPASWRAHLVLGNMTQAEKLLVVHGAGGFVAGVSYVGHVPAIGRLGIPAINLEDGPQVGVSLYLCTCACACVRARVRLCLCVFSGRG